MAIAIIVMVVAALEYDHNLDVVRAREQDVRRGLWRAWAWPWTWALGVAAREHQSILGMATNTCVQQGVYM